MFHVHTVLFKFIVRAVSINLDAHRKNYRLLMMIKVSSLQLLFRNAMFLSKVNRKFNLSNIEFMVLSLLVVRKLNLLNNFKLNILRYMKLYIERFAT